MHVYINTTGLDKLLVSGHIFERNITTLESMSTHLFEKALNPLTTDDECTCRETLAACYQLAQSVLIGRIGGGGRVSARGAVHMAAALAGCRKALVGIGLSISLLFDTNGCR